MATVTSGGTARRRVAALGTVLGLAALAAPMPSALGAGSHAGAASVRTAATSRQARQSLRVLSYNVLEDRHDGDHEHGQVVAPWAERKVAAARLIAQDAPDVVAVQEAADWAGPRLGPRQIDTLVSALGGAYALAHTEAAPGHRGWRRTGVYLLYRTSTYRAVGRGGHWALGDSRWAAYQELADRQTGARVLAASVHLLVGFGSRDDARREAETRTLVQKARAFAGRRGLPIVYAGDFNSHAGHNHAFDGPGIAMRRAHVADAIHVTHRRVNARFNSANGYYRRPPAFRRSVDHVYVDRGVTVSAWRQLLDLSHGRFVGIIPSDHNPIGATVSFRYTR